MIKKLKKSETLARQLEEWLGEINVGIDKDLFIRPSEMLLCPEKPQKLPTRDKALPS